MAILITESNAKYGFSFLGGHPPLFGWNLPGSTSLLAECHQIICKADILLGSFFQRNAGILLPSFNER